MRTPSPGSRTAGRAAGLGFHSLSKSFPGVRALDGISFTIRPGSVHALLGENGAGKSTLLKILGGSYRPDAGELQLEGQSCSFHSPAEAYRAGIAVIHQELHLAPDLTVAENLYLGHLPGRAGWIDQRALREGTRRQLSRLGEDLDPDAKVGTLPIAQRQMLEIAKALAREARVIAFDEPTSSLSAREVERLFAIIRLLRDEGRIILYVSHRMEEIFALCDGATVLRDGRHIETFLSLDGLTPDRLIQRMVGRALSDLYPHVPRTPGPLALEAEGLWGPGLAQPLSLSVRQGEIVGLFGLVGAGRTELLRLLYGAPRPRAGTVRIAGRPVAIDQPAAAIRAGMVLCPEDRKKEGIVGIRSVRENINLSARRTTARLGFLIDERWEQDNAVRQVAALLVKTPSLAQRVVHLSGGNQQKVVLARWLSEQVRVILLDEPTRGIDVGARGEIYAIINDLAAAGTAVLLASSDLPEVLGLADRVIVMRQGAFAGELSRAEATEERCLRLALPVQKEPAHA